jgi:hypothetical protein
MTDSSGSIINEQDDKAAQEKIYRRMTVPGGNGLTYGELFEDMKKKGELLPDEKFLPFVARIQKTQPPTGEPEPDEPYSLAV